MHLNNILTAKEVVEFLNRFWFFKSVCEVAFGVQIVVRVGMNGSDAIA